MTKTDKIFRSLFVALAVGLGWGIRGHFGGSVGAMFPGAMLGLSFAYVSGQKSMIHWMPLLGAVSAWFISLGGNMTYGLLHGYAASGAPAHWINYAYGFLMLILQGGSWGIFGTAAIALLLEKKEVKLIEVVHLAGYVYLCAWLFSLVIIKWWGFHINPPRGDSLVNHFGGAVGLVIWLLQNKRRYPLRGAIVGFFGFGLGMSLGRMNANILDYFHVAINSWNVMEITCGATGGFLFTYFMIERTFIEPKLKKPLLITANAMAAFYVLGIIPLLLWFGVNEKEIQGMKASLESWGYVHASVIAGRMLTWINITLVIGFLFALLWAFLYFLDKRRYVWAPVLVLGLAVMLIDLFIRLYFYYPALKEGYIDMRTCTVFIYLTMVLYIVLREWKFPHTGFEFNDKKTEWIPWKRLSLTTVVVYLLMMVVASNTNSELMKRKISNTRFPVWNRLKDGPFDKKDSVNNHIEFPRE
ncbi:MAG: hypothetical protein AB2L24_20865 [Mangrovibacterium sp.]